MSAGSNGVMLGAGGILTRVHRGRPQVATITRVRDSLEVVALPEGKVESSDFSPEAAAIREVKEQTGIDARLGEFAGCVSYATDEETKVVLFWLMEADAGVRHEVGDIREVRRVQWRELHDAGRLLTHPGQRDLLERVTTLAAVSSGPAAGRRFGRLLGRSDPQLVRLREEVADVDSALRHAAASLRIAPRRAAETHIARAWRAASDRDTDTGWGQAARAREQLIFAFDRGAIRRMAIEVEAEVRLGDKLNAWRRETVGRLLGPILDPGCGPPLGLHQEQLLLQSAVRVRNEAVANGYRGLTILRRHQSRLLVIGAIALVCLLLCLLSYGSLINGPPTADGWLMASAVAMGVVGAVTSAAQRTIGMDQEAIPKRLSSDVASFSRIPIGGVAGLLVWLGSFTAVAPAGHQAAYVLVGAFGAGFTERLVAPSKGA